MNLIKYNEALQIISDFKQSPLSYIEKINSVKGLPVNNLLRSEVYISDQLSKVTNSQKKAITNLSDRLDKLNKEIINRLPLHISIPEYGFELVSEPIGRVGIYIPKRMPSSAYTFLSAAKAAGVSDIVIFLAQDDDGNVDPLTLYIALKYGATILTGPARTAFPTLAFGIQNVIDKCNMICGPCGSNMNIIKNLCGLIGQVAVDMSAGPSDITIITDNGDHWEQIYLDLLSQLEHGWDSTSKLIIVGNENIESYKKSRVFELLLNSSKTTVYYVDEPNEAIKIVHNYPPETLEILSRESDVYNECYKYSGVIYKNTSSTLGDYGAIGRGCADPTGGFVIGQSGISPLKFLKVISVVTNSKLNIDLLNASSKLADYESLSAHKNVIDYFLNNL